MTPAVKYGQIIEYIPGAYPTLTPLFIPSGRGASCAGGCRAASIHGTYRPWAATGDSRPLHSRPWAMGPSPSSTALAHATLSDHQLQLQPQPQLLLLHYDPRNSAKCDRSIVSRLLHHASLRRHPLSLPRPGAVSSFSQQAVGASGGWPRCCPLRARSHSTMLLLNRRLPPIQRLPPRLRTVAHWAPVPICRPIPRDPRGTREQG